MNEASTSVTKQYAIGGIGSVQFLLTRSARNDSPLRKFLHVQAYEANAKSSAPLISEAKDLYLRAKGVSHPKSFTQVIDRTVNKLFEFY
jgi:hypothetical protein